MSLSRIYIVGFRTVVLLHFAFFTLGQPDFGTRASPLFAGYVPPTVVDQTPFEPLTKPTPGSFNSRYLSGIGLDQVFSVFFEDRNVPWPPTISYVSTNSGPLNFPLAATATTIADTHFLIKDWPFTYESTVYSHRAWGSVGNNADHHYYVSNDLTNWILVSTFTIPNAAAFTTARGFVYYGFHDVILINGTYYAWGEANSGETMIVRSNLGGDIWEAFATVGGNQTTDGPLATPDSATPPTPTGSFFELESNQGYGKLYIPGDDSGIYLAINLAAKPSQDPATLEANFINPANWTWHDGSTGRLTPAHAILAETSDHDYREAWMVPRSDPGMPWTIIYTADYSGTRALGFAGPPSVCTPGLPCLFLPIIHN